MTQHDEDLFAEVHRRGKTVSDKKNKTYTTMSVIVDAVTEVLEQANQQTSPLAYFGAFASAIEKENNTSHISALLQLIFLTAQRIPVSVFTSRFDVLGSLFLSLIQKYDKQEFIVANALSCIMWTLQSQPNSAWLETEANQFGNPEEDELEENKHFKNDSDDEGNDREMDEDKVDTKRNEMVKILFQQVVNFLVDRRRLVRQKAKEAVVNILQLNKSGIITQASAAIAQLTAQTINNCTTKDCQQGVDLLTALHQDADPIITYLKPSAVTRICKLLIELSSIKNNDLTLHAYETLLVVFNRTGEKQKRPLSATNCAFLLQSLMEAAPVYSDTKLPILHIKVVSRGFIMLTLSTKTLSKYMNLINTLLPQYFTLFLERNFQHEAGFAAATAKHMKTVITECITSEMVQDANMANMSDDDDLPALKQIIAAFHNSLNIKNKNNLDVVLALLGDLFQRLGKKSYPVMRPIVLTLDQLRDNSDDFKLIGSLERAIGAAISAMGPKHLLSILPLNINSQADGNVRGWMLELLKDYTINTNLQFFIDDIVPLVQHFQTRANKEGSTEFGRNLNALVDQLWATLPGFCTFPTDFAKSFKTIAGDMSTHLMHAQHVNVICTALLRLIQRTKVVLTAGHAPEGVDFSITAAKEVLDGMAKYSKNFLPILFNLYTGDHQTVHKDIVARTVNAFCQISTSETVDEYFKQVLHKLLTITTDTEEQTQRKYMFTDLALSMITLNLTPKALELLYKLILPQIASKRDHTTQKKAYRAFLLISQSVPLFFQEHLDEILKQFKTSLESLHSSAKKYRIRCLCRVIASPVIIENYDKLSAYIPQLLVEGILNSTEVNTQTQQYSSKMLRALLNRICEVEINDDDSDDDEAEEEEAAFVVPKSMNAHQQERLCAFFKSMTSGLGGASDTMISATINVLSTLVHDYGDFIEPVIPDLLASVAVLIDYDNKDVTMAVIQFMKMALGLLDAEFLKQYMATVLRGMLHQAGQKGAGVIRTRVKYMIEKMLKKFGYEFVASIWPSTEKISYLNNLNKQNKKKGPEGRRIVKAKRKLSAGVTLNNDKNEGEVLDLMDPTTVNRISAKKGDNEMKDDKDDVEIEVNKSGKLVIRDLKDDDVVEDSKKEKKTKKQPQSKKRGRESEENLAMDDYEDETGDKEEDTPRNEDERASKRGRAENGGSFNAQRYLQRKQQERDQARHKGPKNTANLGSDYKAKHRGTGGDMKRKGKADPYAYVPLDAGRLNKRSRNTESNFDKLERGGSKGTRGRGRR